MKLIENLDEIKNSKRHYFNVALNNLLPTLQSNISDLNERLISVYCLIGLYLPYDLSLNPFLPSIKQILKFEVKNLNDTNKILIWFTSNLVYNNEKAFNDFSPLDVDEISEEFNKVGNHYLNDLINTINNDIDNDNDNHDNDNGKSQLSSIDQNDLIEKACKSTLSLSEQKIILNNGSNFNRKKLEPHLIPSLINFNPQIAHVILLPLLGFSPNHLSQLISLPPQRPYVHVLGNLIRLSPDLIKSTILGPFISNAIDWIDNAPEIEESGVKNLCMFMNTLIGTRIITSIDDPIAIEMSHFSLRYSKYTYALELYKSLNVH